MEVNAARLEDRLGPNEPPYKSRGEAQVGRLLDRYGIPFFYEAPLTLHDRGRYRIWHPDFMLPTYGNLVVEYAGMPDRSDYMAGVWHKHAAYAANNVPALFIYPQALRGPDWPRDVLRQITHAYRQKNCTTRYPTRSGLLRSAGPRFAYSRPCGYRR